MYTLLPKENIQLNATAYRFQGREYGNIPLSFFWVLTPPGKGPDMHVHPYKEIFVLLHGQATFTIGDEALIIHAGNVVIVPANTPHQFKNSGEEPLQMLSMHPSEAVVQEFLDR